MEILKMKAIKFSGVFMLCVSCGIFLCIFFQLSRTVLDIFASLGAGSLLAVGFFFYKNIPPDAWRKND